MNKAKLLGLVSAVGLGLTTLVNKAFAAADPALVNATTDIATSVKDNVTGAALSPTFITALGVLVGIPLVIFMIIRFLKRGSK